MSFLIDWMTLISGLVVLGAILIFILPSRTAKMGLVENLARLPWRGPFGLLWPTLMAYQNYTEAEQRNTNSARVALAMILPFSAVMDMEYFLV